MHSPLVVRGFLVAASILAVFAAATLLWRRVPGVLEENHYIESAQAFLLLMAAAINLLRSRHPLSDGSGALYHQTLGLLCVSLFAREVDLDRIGSHGAWPVIEGIFRAVVVLLWILVAARVLRHRASLWAERYKLLLSPASLCVHGGIVLYGCSWFFDKAIFPIAADPALFAEELLQLQAALLFFVAPLLFPSRRGGGGVLRPDRRPAIQRGAIHGSVPLVQGQPGAERPFKS